jgi:hypothetical protein
VKPPAANSVKPHQRERKKMRKTISVAALLLALTFPAYAGDMQNDTPKPPTNTATVEDGTQGTFQSGVIQVALDLLALLPSLF